MLEQVSHLCNKMSWPFVSNAVLKGKRFRLIHYQVIKNIWVISEISCVLIIAPHEIPNVKDIFKENDMLKHNNIT